MRSGGSSGSGAPGAPPFGLVASITVTGIAGSTIVIPVLPDVVADLGGGTAAIGWLVAAVSAPGILVAPLIGVLADRFGRRDLVVPCLALFGLAGALAAMAPNLGVLLVLRVAQGVGSAGLINLAVTIVGDHWHGPERARMLGRNAAVLTTCVVISPTVGGLLASVWGWRAAFAPLSLGLATAAAVALRLPNTRRRDTGVLDQLRAAVPYLRSRRLVGAMLAGSLSFVLIFGIFLAVLPAHLAGAFGASPALRGLAAGAPAVTSTAAALLLGRLSARFAPWRLVGASLVLFAAGFALLAAARSIPVVFLAAMVYGAGEGVVIPTLQGMAAGVAPESSRGSVVALFVGAVRAGQTAGPVLATAGLDAVGARATFLAGAVVALAAGAASLLAPSRSRRADPPPAGAVVAYGEGV